jgi:Domain of unknown function (DUF4267)
MHLAALILALIGCVGSIALGSRFLIAPREATRDFGLAADDFRGLAYVGGVRNITSAVVMLVVWAVAGSVTFGWALVAAALTPIADAAIVLSKGGKLSAALGRHGLAAGLLIAVGLILALG